MTCVSSYPTNARVRWRISMGARYSLFNMRYKLGLCDHRNYTKCYGSILRPTTDPTRILTVILQTDLIVLNVGNLLKNILKNRVFLEKFKTQLKISWKTKFEIKTGKKKIVKLLIINRQIWNHCWDNSSSCSLINIDFVI